MELEFGSQVVDDDKTTAPTTVTSSAPKPPPNIKPCRYGTSCTRPDCKFWHPELDEANPQQSEEISNKCARLGLSWIPHQVRNLSDVLLILHFEFIPIARVTQTRISSLVS